MAKAKNDVDASRGTSNDFERAVAKLSFVRGRNFWHVEPTGDWVDENKIGRRLGLEYLEFQQRHDLPILGWIVKDMPREFTGIEVAFLGVMALAVAASGNHALAFASQRSEVGDV
jgi:hypothetical protein